MARKQVGMVDEALLARVDERAKVLGQTRRVFVERALEEALSEGPPPFTVGPVQEWTRAELAEGMGLNRNLRPLAGLGKGPVAPRPKGKR